VLAVEYPGYGIYPGKACAEQILLDAEGVIKYLISDMEIQASDIILFGRSMGSGPATELASIV